MTGSQPHSTLPVGGAASTCTPWPGRVGTHGYGLDGNRLAHRVAYEIHHGQIGRGQQIHHTCGTRTCVNPEHLVSLTAAQHNAIHGPPAGFVELVESRRQTTHCPKGHPYDAANTLLKRGRRHCRACENERSRAYHAKHRERLLPAMRERSRRGRETRG